MRRSVAIADSTGSGRCRCRRIAWILMVIAGGAVLALVVYKAVSRLGY